MKRTDLELLAAVYRYTGSSHRMDLTSEERAELQSIRAEIAERIHQKEPEL